MTTLELAKQIAIEKKEQDRKLMIKAQTEQNRIEKIRKDFRDIIKKVFAEFTHLGFRVFETSLDVILRGKHHPILIGRVTWRESKVIGDDFATVGRYGIHITSCDGLGRNEAERFCDTEDQFTKFVANTMSKYF